MSTALNKYCKYCGTEHPLTAAHWYRLDSSPRCKVFKLKQEKAKYDPVRQRELNRKRREKNPEADRERSRQWREKNAEKHRANAMAWYHANRKHAQATQNTYKRNRERVDPCFKLARRLRSRMYTALKGNYKTGSAIRDLGCTVGQLKQYLEEQFQFGMNWDNYGKAWEIDHILALANYQLTDRGTFRRLVHYSNLQPLWKHENNVKKNKE